MKNYGWLAVASAAALCACSGGLGAGSLAPVDGSAAGTNSTARTAQSTLAGTTGVWGQVVHALPNQFTLDACGHQAGTFDAQENFEGNVTATVSDPSIVSVSPDDQRNRVDPTDGGLKNAWFTITPLAAGSTTIIVTDKKGNADQVTVNVIGCPTPTPSPSATPGRLLPPGGIH